MIYLNLPVGGVHGWGICGKYVAREMANLAPVCLIPVGMTADSIGNELEFYALRELLPRSSAMPDLGHSAMLQAIVNKTLVPIRSDLKARHTVGYCFFEDNRLLPEFLENGRRNFNIIATGSSWCTEVLKQYGLASVATVIQGIDPTLFFPADFPRQLLRDRFVVFSGGKFELRKGQDVVIRAFKVLQDRHPDAVLVTAWFNQWEFSWNTMSGSPYIRFTPRRGDYLQVLNALLAENGVDPNRCINLLPRPNSTFAGIYRNTDVGIFPNRCEGGTNLVLMEYMACGMPVIATAATGHADVITSDNARVINCPTSNTIHGDGQPIADWPEPDLEQAIEHLEWSYQNRDRLQSLGKRGGADMAKLTWRQTAEAFLKLLEIGSHL